MMVYDRTTMKLGLNIERGPKLESVASITSPLSQPLAAYFVYKVTELATKKSKLGTFRK